MGIPKFNKEGHRLRRAHQCHGNDDSCGVSRPSRKYDGATTAAVGNAFVEKPKEKDLLQLATREEHERQQQQRQRKAKMIAQAKSRISRSLMDNYDSEDELGRTFMERHNGEGAVESIEASQLELGDLLGSGAFATVRAIKSIRRNSPDNDCSNEDEDEMLVVKTLRPERVLQGKNTRTAVSIASDLVKEGAILADLSGHRNVLRLAGWTPSGLEGFFRDDADNKDESANKYLLRPDGFVLVLERLSTTLKDKLPEWRAHSKRLRRERLIADIVHPLHRHHGDDPTSSTSGMSLWNERLEALRQLAAGIDHMHSRRIIHRDLKPDNVGFDSGNVLKIFDLNVARKLPSSDSDRLFRMTRSVGSRRYMAPEVGLTGEYNEKVDVYSFGLLAYQVLALPHSDKVYPDVFTVEEHERRVFLNGERPKLPRRLHRGGHASSSPSQASGLREIIERSWSATIQDRPSAKELEQFFADEIASIVSGSDGKTLSSSTATVATSSSQSSFKTSPEATPGTRLRRQKNASSRLVPLSFFGHTSSSATHGDRFFKVADE